ncbi:nucleotide exchange factor GrpE [Phosphitispora sp. TUW77]|uniref:nucleotide exchange factor GrpE n=1 Tax=Phosphitispora sp. TUW77 TaxID=3152361 RepID=UPI003AB474BE
MTVKNKDNEHQLNTEKYVTDEHIKDDKIQQDTGTEPVIDGPEEAAKDININAKAEEYLQLLQRVQADFDNFRRRTLQERQEAAKYCSQRLVTVLLPVIDNFERALKAEGEDLQVFRNGIEMIYRQLRDVLEKEGVKQMEAVGSQFDPNLHEAVMQEQSDQYDDNVVTEEFQKGYLLADRVIRPAMVKVAKS